MPVLIKPDLLREIWAISTFQVLISPVVISVVFALTVPILAGQTSLVVICAIKAFKGLISNTPTL